LAAEQVHLAAPGDAGARLDAQARAAYKRRLEELREELAEAQRFHDLGRVAKAQEEIDFLTGELTAAYGVGGHARQQDTGSKKIRQAVTKCLRDSLARIRKAHPAPGRHLTLALKTGTFCSYTPEQPISWEV